MNYIRIFFIAALMVLGSVAPGFAFSLGAIDVKSKFGERFDAEIELTTESSSPVEVAVGTEEDYEKLQLKRPDIVDEVMVVPPVERRGNKILIRLSSKKPLFYPSFNLVISASQNRGTLIENYLITVDFKQSIALKVKDDEKKAPEKKEKLKPALQTPEPVEAKVSPEASGEAKKDPALPLKTPTPLVGQTRARPGKKIASIVPRRLPAPVKRSAKSATQSSAKPPPKPEVSLAPDQSSEKPPARVEAPPAASISVTSKRFRPLKNGESLLTLARSIDPNTQQAFRIAVAVWQDNQDQFIQGNMHGVYAGTELNLERLEERLASLDLKTAREILWSQWEEWKIIQKEQAVPEVLPKETEEAAPGETDLDISGIFTLLADWKKSWEEEDLPRHLSHFAAPSEERKGAFPGHLKDFKGRMFRTHDQVRLSAFNSFIYHRMGETRVSFFQMFFSDKMESAGRKDMTLVREEGVWKILREKFSVKEFVEKKGEPVPASISPSLKSRAGEAASYVIHVSSHIDLSTATRVVNELRKKGLSAYANPISISDARKIYRVHVGRFSSWDLARGLTRQIRALPIGRFAIPVSAPYALEVGNHADETAAREQVESLRRQNLSPFLFVTSEKDFTLPRFRVLLGAFRQEGSASGLSEKLSRRSIPFRLVQP
ncbi:hypothetical protein UR09_01355 [Candidatus Nitromaritima sp. SCGC AAA799-A02]|nr:hypothetical protein UR09_01355 [Candidatus Nitromaritima sp. SCGC AAA799-A02]